MGPKTTRPVQERSRFSKSQEQEKFTETDRGLIVAMVGSSLRLAGAGARGAWVLPYTTRDGEWCDVISALFEEEIDDAP